VGQTAFNDPLYKRAIELAFQYLRSKPLPPFIKWVFRTKLAPMPQTPFKKLLTRRSNRFAQPNIPALEPKVVIITTD
jgi:hypothetical protein